MSGLSVTETYLRDGRLHVQYNVLDAQTLRDAQLHPEMHKDLVVRMGGFSACFVHLTREVQDDIIARTEQALQPFVQRPAVRHRL